MPPPPPKYPRTPHLPWSASRGRDDREHPDPQALAGRRIVITEKLDGANTLIHRGIVYGRSTGQPSTARWTAMVRKHHAWKMVEPELMLYGEDLYAVHSIAYAPIAERTTFRAFALRTADGRFESVETLEALCATREIDTVPVLWTGVADSVAELRELTESLGRMPSTLGGVREGVVVRASEGFNATDFATHTAKWVRPNHVQTDEHWTRRWRPCAIIERKHRS